MAETQSPNFKWIKPDLGGDASTWGNVLNTTTDAIDSTVWANQQAICPIGTIMMYGGYPAPSNWLMCDGSVYLNTDVPALAPILGTAYPGSDSTHTAVPNLQGRMPIGRDGVGYTRGLTGGETNHTLLSNEMPIHGHTATQAAHTHGSYQDVHTHAIAVAAHTHSIYQDAHNHGDQGHVHPVSASQDAHVHGGVVTGLSGPGTGAIGGQVGGGNLVSGNSAGASQNNVYVSIGTGYANLVAAQPAVHCDTQQPGASADNRQPVVHVDTQQPAVTVTNAGGGGTHNNMPPYVCVCFIIRYK